MPLSDDEIQWYEKQLKKEPEFYYPGTPRQRPNDTREEILSILKLNETARLMNDSERIAAIKEMLPTIFHHMEESRDVDFVGYEMTRLKLILGVDKVDF